jgi:hypothetical protein
MLFAWQFAVAQTSELPAEPSHTDNGEAMRTISEYSVAPGVKFSVTSDLDAEGDEATAKVKMSCDIDKWGVKASYTFSETTIKASRKKNIEHEKKWSIPGGTLKATARIYPPEKVKHHWEQRASLTVRLNGDEVAHPRVFIKF